MDGTFGNRDVATALETNSFAVSRWGSGESSHSTSQSQYVKEKGVEL